MSGIADRLREMGLELPPRRSAGQYVGAVRSGNLVFVSGAGPGGPSGFITGKVGDMDVSQRLFVVEDDDNTRLVVDGTLGGQAFHQEISLDTAGQGQGLGNQQSDSQQSGSKQSGQQGSQQQGGQADQQRANR